MHKFFLNTLAFSYIRKFFLLQLTRKNLMVKNLKRYRKQVERDQGKQEAQKYPLLYRCWDSAACELLDATKVQNSKFSHWSSTVEFRITEYNDTGRLQLAGSEDTDLSCHMPIFTFRYTVWSQSTNVTERRMNWQTSCLYRNQLNKEPTTLSWKMSSR